MCFIGKGLWDIRYTDATQLKEYVMGFDFYKIFLFD